MIFSKVCVVLCFVIYPLLAMFALCAKRKSLRLPKFKKAFGIVYEEVDNSKRIRRFHSIIFFLRRYMIIYISLHWGSNTGVQILTLLLVNLFMQIYVGYIRPFKHRAKNKTELINEGFIYELTILMVLNSSFCPDVDFRYKLGSLSMILIFFNVFFNFSVMIQSTLRKVWMYVKKYSKLAWSYVFKGLMKLMPKQIEALTRFMKSKPALSEDSSDCE